MAIHRIKGARYLVAKFVSDPARMEPRNIGVIVWAAGGLACRFGSPSEMRFVDDAAIYQRWVNYWTACCQKKEMPGADGTTVPRRSAEILATIRATQDGNYLLHEGGYFLESIPAGERQDAADYLYSRLVVDPRRAHDISEERDTLKDRCDAVLQSSGITEREDFTPNCPIQLTVEGINQEFRFDYALNNGKPLALLQRVNLRTQPSTTTAAFLFECARETARTKRALRFALIDGAEAQTEPLQEGRQKMLRKFCDVIDLSNQGVSIDRLGLLSEQ